MKTKGTNKSEKTIVLEDVSLDDLNKKEENRETAVGLPREMLDEPYVGSDDDKKDYNFRGFHGKRRKVKYRKTMLRGLEGYWQEKKHSKHKTGPSLDL